MPRRRNIFSLAVLSSALVLPVVVVAGTTPASASSPTTLYVPGTPSLATITDGTSAAPWNLSQGDPAFPAYASVNPGSVLPTYTPGGATAAGSPNLAVYPGADSGTDGAAPYPSGTVGTPGPLAGYCGTGDNATASSGTPARQPFGSTLPLAPAYFPQVVRNSDGSLTGYFDYRPKDADEAVVAARSTDNGKDWTYESEALEQNPIYCPSADINDDGEGHANVITVGSGAGATTDLYTLERAAGDNVGVGMLVHTLHPTATDPLAGAPAVEKSGVDPDDFASGAVTINATAQPISLATPVGSGPEQLVPGQFVDLTATPTPTATSVISCTGVGPQSLTGCTSAAPGGISVAPGHLIEQVIATVSSNLAASAPATGCPSGSTTATTSGGGALPCAVPAGPNTTTGDGGLEGFGLTVTNANNLTMSILNADAPNRAYIDGIPVYCDQSNAFPTNKLENCTTGSGAAPLVVSAGDPLTSDPIVPSGVQQTTGLVAPDGIVGVLPSYPNAPPGSTVVMYTEKVLNYFVFGFTGSKTTFSGTTSVSLAYTNFPNTASVPLGSGPFLISIGDATNNTTVTETCTGLTTTSTGGTLTGCTGGRAGDTISKNSYLGGPGAATVPAGTLALTGEGSATNAQKLFKNNEDLTLLRVAYTTDGVNFSSAGLPNGGIISGNDSQTSPGGAYSDINNPTSTTSPTNLNAYATAGTEDATEMRFVGSAGSIITNPDGTYGLFLSGAWAADGDSDAFNQVFYSSSSDGEHWSEPVSVISTDYTFHNSYVQETSGGALGISAYFEGRAYGPSVVENSDGSLTMVFAGYRLPKTVANVGSSIGTDPAQQWTIGPDDPALYRNILSVRLQPSPSTQANSTLALSASSASPVYGQADTLAATVSPQFIGALAPTGTVSFTEGGNPLPGCGAVALNAGTPDVATCSINLPAGSHAIVATYNGSTSYAGSYAPLTLSVTPAPLIVTADAKTRLFGQPNPAFTATLSGFVNNETFATAGVTGQASCSTTATPASPVGSYPLTCTKGTLSANNYSFTNFVQGTLTVTYSKPCLVGPQTGGLSVASGQAICVGPGGSVTGPVNVAAGGALDVERGVITGPVRVTGGAVRLCGARVTGPLDVTSSAVTVVIGDDDGPVACAGNTVTGPVDLTGNTSGVEFDDNAVTGPVTISGTSGTLPPPDSGSVDATGNHVTGPFKIN